MKFAISYIYLYIYVRKLTGLRMCLTEYIKPFIVTTSQVHLVKITKQRAKVIRTKDILKL